MFKKKGSLIVYKYVFFLEVAEYVVVYSCISHAHDCN